MPPSPAASTVDGVSNPGSEKPKLRKDANPVQIKHPKAVSQPTRDGTVAAIASDRREPEASRNRQVTGGLSCTKMLERCGVVCAANTGRPDCASMCAPATTMLEHRQLERARFQQLRTDQTIVSLPDAAGSGEAS